MMKIPLVHQPIFTITFHSGNFRPVRLVICQQTNLQASEENHPAIVKRHRDTILIGVQWSVHHSFMRGQKWVRRTWRNVRICKCWGSARNARKICTWWHRRTRRNISRNRRNGLTCDNRGNAQIALRWGAHRVCYLLARRSGLWIPDLLDSPMGLGCPSGLEHISLLVLIIEFVLVRPGHCGCEGSVNWINFSVGRE